MKLHASVLAASKLNMHLHVLGKRADGYHELRTLFQMVSLSDELSFSLDSEGRGMSISGGATAFPQDDLMYKAWRAFCAAANIKCGLHVRINKKIPLQAGLGGGSSDCAAVLSFLNEAFDGVLPEKSLLGIAGKLGSDVPFFLTGTAAYAGGRGEELAQVEGRLGYWVLVTMLEGPMDTALAYRLLDENNLCGGTGPDREKIIAAYEEDPPEKWPFFNTFGELYKTSEDYRGAADVLKMHGADFWSLTGSGNAFYGVFSEKAAAKRAFEAVSPDRKAWLVQPLERKPFTVLQ